MNDQTGRILVVDDEETILKLLSEVLVEDGHQVETAFNAEEAISLFEKNPFPLVITDIRMGNISGIDLLKIIKTSNEDTQVIIITSHASLETAMTTKKEGAYDFLVKPFDDLDDISDVVNRAFDKIRLISENRELRKQVDNHKDNSG
jgi:DNA-binding NtrC family response regulator